MTESAVRVAAFIQVRLGSSRFPGKALHPLAGQPALAWTVAGARLAATVARVVVVTSTDPADDRLVDWCREAGIDCARGPLRDVAARFLAAWERFPAGHVVRLCGDAPLIPPTIVDRVVAEHLAAGNDYTTNGWNETATYPKGFEVRVVRGELLAECVARRGPELIDRENPLAWLHEHLAEYRVGRVAAPPALARRELRLVLDYPGDAPILERVFTECLRGDLATPPERVVAFIDGHPELLALMNGVKDELARRVSTTSTDTSWQWRCPLAPSRR